MTSPLPVTKQKLPFSVVLGVGVGKGGVEGGGGFILKLQMHPPKEIHKTEDTNKEASFTVSLHLTLLAPDHLGNLGLMILYFFGH